MNVTPSLTVKLLSIAVHVDEARQGEKRGEDHPFDWMAVDSLLSDPGVRGFLDDPENAALLPLRRNAL